MPDADLQQILLELRQLRGEIAALVQRFDALGPAIAPGPTVDAAPAPESEFDRAVAMSRGIISGPPGAGGGERG